MTDTQPAQDDDQQARVIARTQFQRAANATGDIDTMRAAALILHTDYTDRHPASEETPR